MRICTPLSAALVCAALVSASSASAETLQERRQTAEAAFASLKADSPKAVASWQTGIVGPALVTRARFAAEGKTPRARAEAFLAAHAALFGVAPSEMVFKSESVSGQKTAVHFEQWMGTKRVLRRGLTLTICPTGHVTSISNNILPIVNLRSARVGADKARGLALAKYTEHARTASSERIETVIVAGPGDAYEAALVHVAPEPGKMNVIEVIVDLDRAQVTGQQSTLRH